MNDTYLLERLIIVSRALRKAQRQYYAYKGNLKEDPIKQAYYQEARRREEDLDMTLREIEKIHPVPFNN